MAITTYATLKTAISAWVERTADTTYVSEVDTFIDMAEARINRAMLGDPRMEATTTLSTDSNGEATIPSDYIALRFAFWDASTDRPLDVVSWEQLKRLNKADTSGVPCRLAIRNTTLKLGPIKSGSVDFNYYAKITALSDSDTTNWLLDIAPDVYLIMCMAMGNLFVGDLEQSAALESKAVQLIQEVREQGQMSHIFNAGMSIQGTVA